MPHINERLAVKDKIVLKEISTEGLEIKEISWKVGQTDNEKQIRRQSINQSINQDNYSKRFIIWIIWVPERSEGWKWRNNNYQRIKTRNLPKT